VAEATLSRLVSVPIKEKDGVGVAVLDGVERVSRIRFQVYEGSVVDVVLEYN
jgi:hypothetical protein